MNKENKSKFKSLDPKTKTLYIFLIIITLGIFYLIVRSKIKKAQEKSTNEQSKKSNSNAKKLSFDVNDLIQALGSITNIKAVEATISSVKVTIKSKTNIDIDKIKNLTKKGVMVSSNQVSIILGDQTQIVKEMLENKLDKVKNEK